jgi:hypothetical protein
MRRYRNLIPIALLTIPWCPATEPALRFAPDIDRQIAAASLDMIPPHDDSHGGEGSTAPAVWRLPVAENTATTTTSTFTGG